MVHIIETILETEIKITKEEVQDSTEEKTIQDIDREEAEKDSEEKDT